MAVPLDAAIVALLVAEVDPLVLTGAVVFDMDVVLDMGVLTKVDVDNEVFVAVLLVIEVVVVVVGSGKITSFPPHTAVFLLSPPMVFFR